jgi:hypothetical protein
MTSLVATRLKAGGYLSYYLRTACRAMPTMTGQGDHLRRAEHLFAAPLPPGGDIPATTREDEANYQYLMVERGGIHIEDGGRAAGGQRPQRQRQQPPIRTTAGGATRGSSSR